MIFGGTFDPPHCAHIELPRQAARAVGADELVYVPAAVNPHKMEDPPVDARHRVAMLRLALDAANEEDDAGEDDDVPTSISTIEIHRGGPSYFVETLRAMAEANGTETHLTFLMGADQVVNFHRWKDWETILQLAEPAIMLRPPWTRKRLRDTLTERVGEERAAWWTNHIVDLPTQDVSSTEIRRSRQRERIDDAVAAYIREHDLYE